GLSRIFKVEITAPPLIKEFWQSFRYRAIDVQDDTPGYLLNEDQLWPYIGQILVLHVGRWLSILFSAIALSLIYLVLLEIRPDQPHLALAATALLAFLPAFIFIGAALNEDALLAL